MKALVTGVAGFIGSHLAERLLSQGHEVVGVDCFSDYYAKKFKLENLTNLRAEPGFTFVDADLMTVELGPLCSGVDTVFHLAGQPGVRGSWASGFAQYVHDNILATQRLLEAASRAGVRRIVNSSSSSVYGDAATPTTEQSLPAPVSPYGVTKLAAERLVHAYTKEASFDAVSLRYFTVFGPRQRPDMATRRLIDSALTGSEFLLYGDGGQRRDFTFVSDVVDANVKAAAAPGNLNVVVNISGGASITLLDLIEIITTETGNAPNLIRQERQPGDVKDTWADHNRAHEVIGWSPEVTVRDGVAAQVAWQRALTGVGGPVALDLTEDAAPVQ